MSTHVTRLFVLVALLTSCSSVAPRPEPTFRELTLEQAFASAAREGKPILAALYVRWNSGGARMLADTWSDAVVAAWLRENTVAVRLDADEHLDLAHDHHILTYPTQLVLNADGSERARLTGERGPEAFRLAAVGALSGTGDPHPPHPDAVVFDNVADHKDATSEPATPERDRLGMRGRASRRAEALADASGDPQHDSWLRDELRAALQGDPRATDTLRAELGRARHQLLREHDGHAARRVLTLDTLFEQPERTLATYDALADTTPRASADLLRSMLYHGGVRNALVARERWADVIAGAETSVFGLDLLGQLDGMVGFRAGLPGNQRLYEAVMGRLAPTRLRRRFHDTQYANAQRILADAILSEILVYHRAALETGDAMLRGALAERALAVRDDAETRASLALNAFAAHELSRALDWLAQAEEAHTEQDSPPDALLEARAQHILLQRATDDSGADR